MPEFFSWHSKILQRTSRTAALDAESSLATSAEFSVKAEVFEKTMKHKESLMKRYLSVIFGCFLIGSISGCATMTIEGDGQKTPMSEHGTHTVHGSYYNFVWSEPPVEKCDNGQGLYRVRVHTNALYSLVSIVSLGLYVPQAAEWWCDGTPAQDEEEELYKPAK